MNKMSLFKKLISLFFKQNEFSREKTNNGSSGIVSNNHSDQIKSELERTKNALKNANNQLKRLDNLANQNDALSHDVLLSEFERTRTALRNTKTRLETLEKSSLSTIREYELKNQFERACEELISANDEIKILKSKLLKIEKDTSQTISELTNNNNLFERKIKYREKRIEQLKLELDISLKKIEDQDAKIKNLKKIQKALYNEVQQLKEQSKKFEINKPSNLQNKDVLQSPIKNTPIESEEKNKIEPLEGTLSFSNEYANTDQLQDDQRSIFDSYIDISNLANKINEEIYDDDQDESNFENLVEPNLKLSSSDKYNVYLPQEHDLLDDIGPNKKELKILNDTEVKKKNAGLLAFELANKNDLEPEYEKYLKDLFIAYWWSSAISAIKDFVMTGATKNQIQVIREVKELWALNISFSDFIDENNSIESRKITLPWHIAYQLVNAVRGVPDSEEIEQYLFDSHDIWTDKRHLRMQYPSFLLFVAALVEASSDGDLIPPHLIQSHLKKEHE